MAGGNPFMPPGGAGGGAPVGGGPVPQGPAPRPEGASINAPPEPPSAPPSGNAMLPPSKAGQPFADVHQNLKYAQNRFDTNMKAQRVLDHLRVELDQLMEMGDMVRPENVIESAGRLVGHGIGATQLAQIMSDMPAQGGEGLASWIRMHDVTITNAERQLAQQTSVIQHQLGVAGIRSIAATHMQQEAMGPQMAGQPVSNSLGGGRGLPGVGGGPMASSPEGDEGSGGM